MGVIPNAHAWKFEIHTRAGKCHSKSDVKKYKKHIRWLSKNLTCKDCRNHMVKYLKSHPCRGKSAEDLLYWSWKFHQSVNRRLGKSGISWSECKRRYLFPERSIKNHHERHGG